MRSFKGDIDSLTPGSYVPYNALPFGVYTGTYTDDTLDGGSAGSAVVPSVAVGGKYQLVCDYRPQRSTLSVTLDGIGASMLEFPGVPASAGSVGIDYLSGTLQFHSADVGAVVVATYKHLGTVQDAGSFNQLQADLASAVAGATTLASLTDVDIDGSQANGDVVTWDEASGKFVAAAPAGGGGPIAISDVTGLETALTDLNDSIALVSTDAAAYTDSAVGALSSSTTAALATKADASATTTALAGKASTSHNHTVDSLSNVVISSPTDGQALVWDTTTSKWVNETVSGGGGGVADPTGNGIVAKTGSGTASARTITGTTNNITVSNGDGVSGNPTLNIGSDVATLSGSQTYTGVPTYTGGNIDLNKTGSNSIRFNNQGTAAPAANSVGMKIKLYGGLSGMATSDYAIGVEGSYTWIASAIGAGFKLYAGTFNYATFSGVGNLGLNGRIGVNSATPPNNGAYTHGVSWQGAYRSITSNYNIVEADSVLLGDSTGGAITITLPHASSGAGFDGCVYHIKRVNAGANNVTVGTTSSQTIDGATTYVLAAQYNFVTVVSDGTKWHIIAKG